MARPSVTLPPALLMYRVIGRALSLASSRIRSMTLRVVLLDVADEVDVAQAIGGLLPQDRFDGVDQVEDETVVEVARRGELCELGTFNGIRVGRLGRRSPGGVG